MTTHTTTKTDWVNYHTVTVLSEFWIRTARPDAIKLKNNMALSFSLSKQPVYFGVPSLKILVGRFSSKECSSPPGDRPNNEPGKWAKYEGPSHHSRHMFLGFRRRRKPGRQSRRPSTAEVWFLLCPKQTWTCIADLLNVPMSTTEIGGCAAAGSVQRG